MKSNSNINYCGVMQLLRRLVEQGICTEAESKAVAARIAAETGADIILLP